MPACKYVSFYVDQISDMRINTNKEHILKKKSLQVIFS